MLNSRAPRSGRIGVIVLPPGIRGTGRRSPNGASACLACGKLASVPGHRARLWRLRVPLK